MLAGVAAGRCVHELPVPFSVASLAKLSSFMEDEEEEKNSGLRLDMLASFQDPWLLARRSERAQRGFWHQLMPP